MNANTLFEKVPCPKPLADGGPCGHPLEKYLSGHVDCYSCMTRYRVQSGADRSRKDRGTYALSVTLVEEGRVPEVPKWYSNRR